MVACGARSRSRGGWAAYGDALRGMMSTLTGSVARLRIHEYTFQDCVQKLKGRHARRLGELTEVQLAKRLAPKVDMEGPAASYPISSFADDLY